MTLIIDCDGDSVVYGQVATSYVSDLPAALNALGVTTPTCNNRAVSGQSTQDMLWGAGGTASAPATGNLAAMLAADSPHVVVMQAALLNDCILLRDGLITPAALRGVYRTYMQAVLSHASPTGSPVGLFCTCDNFAGQSLTQSYARAVMYQEMAHSLWLDAVNEFRGNPFVEVVDVWKIFRRFGVDTTTLYGFLDPTDHTHPIRSTYAIWVGAIQYALANLAGGYLAGTAFPATVYNAAPESASDITDSLAVVGLSPTMQAETNPTGGSAAALAALLAGPSQSITTRFAFGTGLPFLVDYGNFQFPVNAGASTVPQPIAALLIAQGLAS